MNWSFPADYTLAPEEFITARLAAAAGMLAGEGLAGALFTHCTDLYHLAGTMMQGALWLAADGAARLFIRRDAGRAAAESPLPVEQVSGFGQVAREVLAAAPPGARVGMCLDVTPAAELLGWQKRLAGLELADIARPYLTQKAVKDAFEAEAMAATGRLAAQVYAAIPELLRPGLTERELAGALVGRAMALGHMDLLRARGLAAETYAGIVLSGPEGCLPGHMDAPFAGVGPGPMFPLGAGSRAIGPGEPVQVDLGLCLGGYQTDQTRTYCLGPAPARVRRAHDALARVQAALVEALRPGAVSGELYDLAVAEAEAAGMGQYFLGPPGRAIRFVGHGVGLELGAPPYLLQGSKALVRAGETYALELKMALPEGPVGLENTVLVNEQGPPTRLASIPEDLVEVPL